MDMIRDILRQYWAHALAWIVFAVAVVRYWRLGNYFEMSHLLAIIFAFGGLVAFVGSDEFAEYTGFYGWSRDKFRNLPALFIRIAGGIALVLATLGLYCL